VPANIEFNNVPSNIEFNNVPANIEFNNVQANIESPNVKESFNRDLISSATLSKADRQLVTDVSGQPIGTDTLSRNVSN
jgi:phage tail sheath gpL-like